MFLQAFAPHYDPDTDTFASSDGISVRPVNFGGLDVWILSSLTIYIIFLKGVRYLDPDLKEQSAGMHVLISALEARGYQEGINQLHQNDKTLNEIKI